MSPPAAPACDNFSDFSLSDRLNRPEVRISLMFSSWWDLGHGFGEGDHRGEVSSHCILSRPHAVRLTLVSWLQWCVSGLVRVKLNPPFHIVLFGRKSRCLRIGQRCSTSLGQSVDKLCGILHGRFVYSTPSIYFINNLRILVCTHGYLYYTLRYNPILCCLFCWWIVPALRLGVLSVGSCASLTQTSITVPLWGTALLSTIRCSSLTLYTPVPESAIPPRNESWLLFIGKWF